MLGLHCCSGFSLIVVSGGFSCCGAWALEHRLNSCDQGLSCPVAHETFLDQGWDLPGPGIERMSPALVGGFFTTEPPGKPYSYYLCATLFKTLSASWGSVCGWLLHLQPLCSYPNSVCSCGLWLTRRRDGLSSLPGAALMLCRGRGHSATPLCSMLHLTHQADPLLLPTHCTSWQVGALL